ncbi:MAG: hypothetical protein R3B53_01085 [Candidatus Paceibacterota bacterium]
MLLYKNNEKSWLQSIFARSSIPNPFVGQANFDTTAPGLLDEKPVSLFEDIAGCFYGSTEGGFNFTQQPVTNEFDLRIQKFVMGDLVFYISDLGVITADSDLMAISIYLSYS